MQQDIHYEGNKLYINGKQIQFKYDVRTIEISDGIVMVLEIPPKDGMIIPDYLDNVYGFSMDGRMLWRIEPPR